MRRRTKIVRRGSAASSRIPGGVRAQNVHGGPPLAPVAVGGSAAQARRCVRLQRDAAEREWASGESLTIEIASPKWVHARIIDVWDLPSGI